VRPKLESERNYERGGGGERRSATKRGCQQRVGPFFSSPGMVIFTQEGARCLGGSGKKKGAGGAPGRGTPKILGIHSQEAFVKEAEPEEGVGGKKKKSYDAKGASVSAHDGERGIFAHGGSAVTSRGSREGGEKKASEKPEGKRGDCHFWVWDGATRDRLLLTGGEKGGETPRRPPRVPQAAVRGAGARRDIAGLRDPTFPRGESGGATERRASKKTR